MFGLTFDKFVLLAVLACLLIGPSRLPEYASRLAQLVKSLRGWGASAIGVADTHVPESFTRVQFSRGPAEYTR